MILLYAAVLLFFFFYIFLNDFTWEAFVIVNFYFVCLWVIIENLFSFSRFVRLFLKVFTDSIMSSSPSVSSGVPPHFHLLRADPKIRASPNQRLTQWNVGSLLLTFDIIVG